jgi:hypothetical protein
LNDGNQASAREYDDHGSELSIFLVRDHGALLQTAGKSRQVLQ